MIANSVNTSEFGWTKVYNIPWINIRNLASLPGLNGPIKGRLIHPSFKLQVKSNNVCVVVTSSLFCVVSGEFKISPKCTASGRIITRVLPVLLIYCLISSLAGKVLQNRRGHLQPVNFHNTPVASFTHQRWCQSLGHPKALGPFYAEFRK